MHTFTYIYIHIIYHTVRTHTYTYKDAFTNRPTPQKSDRSEDRCWRDERTDEPVREKIIYRFTQEKKSDQCSFPAGGVDHAACSEEKRVSANGWTHLSSRLVRRATTNDATGEDEQPQDDPVSTPKIGQKIPRFTDNSVKNIVNTVIRMKYHVRPHFSINFNMDTFKV